MCDMGQNINQINILKKEIALELITQSQGTERIINWTSYQYLGNLTTSIRLFLRTIGKSIVVCPRRRQGFWGTTSGDVECTWGAIGSADGISTMNTCKKNT